MLMLLLDNQAFPVKVSEVQAFLPSLSYFPRCASPELFPVGSSHSDDNSKKVEEASRPNDHDMEECNSQVPDDFTCVNLRSNNDEVGVPSFPKDACDDFLEKEESLPDNINEALLDCGLISEGEVETDSIPKAVLVPGCVAGPLKTQVDLSMSPIPQKRVVDKNYREEVRKTRALEMDGLKSNENGRLRKVDKRVEKRSAKKSGLVPNGRGIMGRLLNVSVGSSSKRNNSSQSSCAPDTIDPVDLEEARTTWDIGKKVGCSSLITDEEMIKRLMELEKRDKAGLKKCAPPSPG